MEAIVTAKGLGKRYTKGRNVVEPFRDLDLTIAPGEFVAVVGPSGSGKSTLLNLIAGFDRPTSGSISVCGVDLGVLSDKEIADWRVQHIGFVFQAFNLISSLTAFENVEVPLRNLRVPRAKRVANVNMALNLVGLSDRARHFPHELSGGEEQRVAIARAFVASPSLLVADEPTGNLDAAAALRVLEIFRTLNEQHEKTVVLVTHDPAAARFASRIFEVKKAMAESAVPLVSAAQ